MMSTLPNRMVKRSNGAITTQDFNAVRLEISSAVETSKTVQAGKLVHAIIDFASFRRKLLYGDRQRYDLLSIGIQQGQMEKKITRIENMLVGINEKLNKVVNK